MLRLSVPDLGSRVGSKPQRDPHLRHQRFGILFFVGGRGINNTFFGHLLQAGERSPSHNCMDGLQTVFLWDNPSVVEDGVLCNGRRRAIPAARLHDGHDIVATPITHTPHTLCSCPRLNFDASLSLLTTKCLISF